MEFRRPTAAIDKGRSLFVSWGTDWQTPPTQTFTSGQDVEKAVVNFGVGCRGEDACGVATDSDDGVLGIVGDGLPVDLDVHVGEGVGKAGLD